MTNVGLVGCGYVTIGHILAWKKVSSARLVAVSDLNLDLARSTALRWKIPYSYKTLPEMMNEAGIDVVDICTPPHVHAPLAVQAMEAGKDVLIEKPMTMTSEDAQRIVMSQENTGRKAGVIHNWLYDEPILRADSQIRKGAVGDLITAEIQALSTKDDSMAANPKHWSHTFPGGRFSEMLAHPIYLLQHFLGKIRVESVSVSKLGEYSWMKSDEFSAIFKSDNRIGRAYATFNAPRDAIYVDLYGRKGLVKVDIINSTVNLLPGRPNKRFSKGFDIIRQAGQTVGSFVGNSTRIVSGRWMSGHDKYIELFAQAIAQNKEPPVSAKQGLQAVELVEEVARMIDDEERRT